MCPFAIRLNICYTSLMRYIELMSYILLGITLVAIPTLDHIYSYWLGVATLGMFLVPAVMNPYYDIKYLFKKCSAYMDNSYHWKQAIASLTMFFIAVIVLMPLVLNPDASVNGLIIAVIAIAEYILKGYLAALGMLVIIGNLLKV